MDLSFRQMCLRHLIEYKTIVSFYFYQEVAYIINFDIARGTLSCMSGKENVGG